MRAPRALRSGRRAPAIGTCFSGDRPLGLQAGGEPGRVDTVHEQAIGIGCRGGEQTGVQHPAGLRACRAASVRSTAYAVSSEAAHAPAVAAWYPTAFAMVRAARYRLTSARCASQAGATSARSTVRRSGVAPALAESGAPPDVPGRRARRRRFGGRTSRDWRRPARIRSPAQACRTPLDASARVVGRHPLPRRAHARDRAGRAAPGCRPPTRSTRPSPTVPRRSPAAAGPRVRRARPTRGLASPAVRRGPRRMAPRKRR